MMYRITNDRTKEEVFMGDYKDYVGLIRENVKGMLYALNFSDNSDDESLFTSIHTMLDILENETVFERLFNELEFHNCNIFGDCVELCLEEIL